MSNSISNLFSILILQSCIFNFNFSKLHLQIQFQFQIYFQFQFFKATSSNSISNLFSTLQSCIFNFNFSRLHLQIQIQFQILQHCIHFARLHFICKAAFHSHSCISFHSQSYIFIHMALRLHFICMVAFYFHKASTPIIFLFRTKVYVHIFTSSLLRKFQDLRFYIF